uniref:Tubby-like protein n=1 Tax=Panagrellus redivivus TaxID=6233 RepID=A0A7E4VL01_PANRE
MESNRAWVEENLKRQRVMLEEKQRARRMQSAGLMRTTNHSAPPIQGAGMTGMVPSSSYSFTHSAHDYVSQPFGDPFSPASHSTSYGVVDKASMPAEPIPVKHIISNSSSDEDIAPTTPGRVDTDQNNDESNVSVQPWHAEQRLEEAVMEDCEVLDVAKAVENIKNFVNEPVGKNHMLRCIVTRDKKGVEKGWYPAYYLHWEHRNNAKIFLLAARRRKKCVTGSYLISCDATEMTRESGSFIGKVRSNALGTEFTVYDNGVNPKKSKLMSQDLRREMTACIYEANVFGFKGPRKMTIVIPGMSNGVRRDIRPVSEKDSLIERFKAGKTDELITLVNKTPVWSEDTQSYVLNFRGRVTQASVKNFQIIHPGNEDYIVLQFGRTTEASFTLDFRYPLSPLQAFGIAMSSFHGKLACE